MENAREFRINDFYQAVILKTVGLPLLRLERGNGKFVTFVFDDPEGRAKKILEEYWGRKIKVIARDLVESVNELKTRLYAGI